MHQWLAPLARKDWIVNVQSPPAHCAGPEAALKYLASYVAGAAIGNKRIIRDDGRRVTFRVKDYRHGGNQVIERIPGPEFVRRFLLHILPMRFRRVRYYGLMGGADNNKNLARCRDLLGVEQVVHTATPAARESEGAGFDDPLAPTCPKCRAEPMEWVADTLVATIPSTRLATIVTLPGLTAFVRPNAAPLSQLATRDSKLNC